MVGAKCAIDGLPRSPSRMTFQMSRESLSTLIGVLLFCVLVDVAQSQSYTRKRDVIYGRKHGVVLTMDVFTPKEKPNGAGLIYVVSGGWYSNHSAISTGFAKTFLNRGYTVFAVVHGSQPFYTIPEIVGDMNMSVRFIRKNAKKFGVEPNRLGIYGGSAGGHLSLMIGTAGKPSAGSRASSRVQAVACFFPPTDFLNYGKKGENALGVGVLKNFQAPFDFKELDRTTRGLKKITDEERRKKIGIAISPAYHVTKDDPPTLIIHGDADKLVPIQQAEIMIEKFKKVGVTSKLIVRKGKAHGWQGIVKDLSLMADWFDTHLKAAK